MKAIQQFVNYAMDTIIFPEASCKSIPMIVCSHQHNYFGSVYFNRGMPLPVSSAIRLIGPKMTLGEVRSESSCPYIMATPFFFFLQGYFFVATDFKYKPTTIQGKNISHRCKTCALLIH